MVTALDAIAQADADIADRRRRRRRKARRRRRAPRSLATGEEAAVSREVVEAAQSKAAADQAALALARRKADAAFGLNAPWRDRRPRAAIMARLAIGRSVLVRVTFPLGAWRAQCPPALTIARLGDDRARAGPRTRSGKLPPIRRFPAAGFYAAGGRQRPGPERARHRRRAGRRGAGRRRWCRPSRWSMGEGEAWVYVAERRRHISCAPGSIPPGRWAMAISCPAARHQAGDKIVTGGAGLLLAHEINPSTEAED